ncbi:MAG: diacylglycerol kinase family lipid kinase [Thermoanaerobaculia bacterium]
MRDTRARLILNPGAGSAVREEVETQLGDRVEIRLTEAPGDATRLAREAVEEGVSLVVAGGGDGTLHEVVNGLLPEPRGTVCGLLPLGTGNDFARTLALPADIAEWATVLEAGRTLDLDAIRVEGPFDPRWAINGVAGGAIDRLDEKMTAELKRFWGPLSYLRATAEALPDLEPFRIEAVFDDGEPIAASVHSVVAANGRTLAGGIPIAPGADPADGRMDCVLVTAVEGLEIVTLGGKVLLGAHLEDERVLFRRARSLSVTSDPPMAFHADGERLDGAWARLTLHPGVLPMLVGPEAAES